MKRFIKGALGLVMSAAMILGGALTNGIDTMAVDTISVTGTVKSGSDTNMIKLNVDDQEMKIKIDSSTDMSQCKVILEGNKISADIYVGSDRYLHATRVSIASGSSGNASGAKTCMLSGTIKNGTNNKVIKLETILGDFDIKFDSATDMSKLSYLAIGRNIAVTICKDAAGGYYATVISDGDNVTTAQTSNSTNTSGSSADMSGKITSSSNAGTLYINNQSGTLTVKVDSSTNTSKGVVLVNDANINAKVYTGSDGCLHFESITQSRAANNYTVDSSNLYSITGRVASGSTVDTIKFDMGDGSVMNLKLDDNTVCSNGLILANGTKIKVTCGRGADAYMHAVRIEKAD